MRAFSAQSRQEKKANGLWLVGLISIPQDFCFYKLWKFCKFSSAPSSSIDREYLCRVYGDINDKKIDKLLSGVKLDDKDAKFSDIVPVKKQGKSKTTGFMYVYFLARIEKSDVSGLLKN